MSRILIVYGTTDGHTRKIAEALGETFRQEECRADVIDASETGPHVRPADYDGVVVAASVHLGHYQRAVERWVRSHGEALNRRPSAFVSVCLAILEKRREARQEVQKIMRPSSIPTGAASARLRERSRITSRPAATPL